MTTPSSVLLQCARMSHISARPRHREAEGRPFASDSEQSPMTQGYLIRNMGISRRHDSHIVVAPPRTGKRPPASISPMRREDKARGRHKTATGRGIK